MQPGTRSREQCQILSFDDAIVAVLRQNSVKSSDQTFSGTKNRCQEASASTGLETPGDAGQPFLNGSIFDERHVLASLLDDDDVVIGAMDNCLQLRLLGSGHAELVKRLLEIVHEGHPLLGRDIKV